MREAAGRRVPVLVVFLDGSAAAAAGRMGEVLGDPEVQGRLAAFAVARVRVDETPEDARALDVRGAPEARLYDPAGLELGRLPGVPSARGFREWLERAAAGKGDPSAPSLAAWRPDPDLDAALSLEAAGKPPDPARLDGLLDLAAGPPREARTEAMRVLRRWAAPLAPEVAARLASPRLRVRVAARDLLSELGVPVEGIDPWKGPAAAGILRAVAGRIGEHPPAPLRASPWTPALEADLSAAETGDASRLAASRDRLVAAGPGVAERLRLRARAIREAFPEAAARLDEIRFRALLPPALALERPDLSRRLSFGEPAARVLALTEALASGPGPGRKPLLDEALCDPEPAFREAAEKALGGAGGKP